MSVTEFAGGWVYLQLDENERKTILVLTLKLPSSADTPPQEMPVFLIDGSLRNS